MLKQPRRGNVRRLSALNRDIMLRSLPSVLFWRAITVFVARGWAAIYRGKCSPDDLLLTFTAYALDGFAYGGGAPGQRLTARVTVSKLLTSGERRVVSQNCGLVVFFTAPCPRSKNILSRY